MTINPINANEIINSVLKTQTSQTAATENADGFIPFEDLLRDALTNVVETDAVVQADAVKIASGDTDALHNITINMAKADLALQTLVQIRNKALDAYNEIMRITL